MAQRTVLVVDDEPLIRWSVGERMRAEGYDVVEAGTGRAALDLFGPGVDVVLLDSRLPDVDGVSILADLLKRKPDLPVIFMTADSNVSQVAQTLSPGRFQVASKPFLLDDLVAMVQRAIGTRSLGGCGNRSVTIPALKRNQRRCAARFWTILRDRACTGR